MEIMKDVMCITTLEDELNEPLSLNGWDNWGYAIEVEIANNC